jgi:biotin carboxyl carrier protein
VKYLVRIGSTDCVVEVRDQGELVVTPEGGEPRRLDLVESSSLLSILMDGRHSEVEFRLDETGVVLIEDGLERLAAVGRVGFGGRVVATHGTASADVRAPMPGLVVTVEVEEGQLVTVGQGVVILEAMKMQNELRTPVGGTVKKVFVTGGTAVDKGQPLVRVEE